MIIETEQKVKGTSSGPLTQGTLLLRALPSWPECHLKVQHPAVAHKGKRGVSIHSFGKQALGKPENSTELRMKMKVTTYTPYTRLSGPRLLSVSFCLNTGQRIAVLAKAILFSSPLCPGGWLKALSILTLVSMDRM